MEPSSSSSPPTLCNGRKRKRPKPARSGDAAADCGPRVSVLPDRLQQPITAEQLRELLHYAAVGGAGGVQQPSWCRLLQQEKVEGVNVVVVEGLSQAHFYQHYLSLRHLRTSYATRVTFTPSSNSLVSGIFGSDVPGWGAAPAPRAGRDGGRLHAALRTHPVITKYGTKRRGLTAFVLSQEEMIQKHFPVKGLPGFEGFACTDSDERVTDGSPLYGLDCEMCLTVRGYQVAHVSVVDGGGECVLDELVQPDGKVLDYLTKFSGITAAILRPVTTKLRDVQAKLRTLLPRDAVLVGHSLNNDLRALQLIHRHVIDTSLLYRKEFGQRFKLKVLADVVLKRQIQTEEKEGHNPIEDALAALELAQYFIRTGPLQVVQAHLEELWGQTLVEESSEIGARPAPAPITSSRFADVLQALGRSAAYLGKRADIALNLANQQWHSSDKEVLASFRRQTGFPFFSVLQLSSLSARQPREEQRQPAVCAALRDMCVVFAGPLPAAFSGRDVRRLFRCCGRVRRVRMLGAAVRVHAEVEFELLEGAALALKALNGLNVQGRPIKVQRPVNESTLDLDVALEALTSDALNARHLHAVRLSAGVAESVSAKVNGPPSGSERSAVNGSPAAGVNGHSPEPFAAKKPRLSEGTLAETFSRFGAVDGIFLPAKPGKHARHARIMFDSREAKLAALSSSADLWKERYLVCPSLTPLHMPSWVATATPADGGGGGKEVVNGMEGGPAHAGTQEQETELMAAKLDRRLAKLFRSLPECTLSVVVLPGQTSAHGSLPGLCLLEVKRGSRGERRRDPEQLLVQDC